jgi:hypothetical protein
MPNLTPAQNLKLIRTVRMYSAGDLQELLFIMAANNPQAFLDALNEKEHGTSGYLFLVNFQDTRLSQALKFVMTKDILGKLQAACDGNPNSPFVSTIKEFRTISGWGLREAKETVQHLASTKDIKIDRCQQGFFNSTASDYVTVTDRR